MKNGECNNLRLFNVKTKKTLFSYVDGILGFSLLLLILLSWKTFQKMQKRILCKIVSSVTYPEIWRSPYRDAASPARDATSPAGDVASP
jgi:hypothetical protein